MQPQQQQQQQPQPPPQGLELLALRSSKRKDRMQWTEKRVADRAYHLVRFPGEESAPPEVPGFALPARVRREKVVAQAEELTEEERRQGLGESKRRPGESQEQYEIRRRTTRQRFEEWRWVLEDRRKAMRWEGREDDEQASSYVVLFPNHVSSGTSSSSSSATLPPVSYKVAFLDQWIEAKRYNDPTDRKAKVKQEKLIDQLRRAKNKNFSSAVDGAGGGNSAKGRAAGTKWVVGRDDEQISQSKKYRQRGTFDDEEDDPGSGDRNNNDGEPGVEVADLEDTKVDHDYGLAIDRMEYDGDEFQELDHEFDDDDHIEADIVTQEDTDGLAEGSKHLAMAVAADLEEGNEEDDEDEESSAAMSSSADEDDDDDDDDDNEDNGTNNAGEDGVPAGRGSEEGAGFAATPPLGQQPQQPVPLSALRNLKSSTPPMPSGAILSQQQAGAAARPKARTPQETLREFMVRTIRLNQSKMKMTEFLKAVRNQYRGAGYPGDVPPFFKDVLKDVVDVSVNPLNKEAFVMLKPDV